jgi:large subunit ribosomal protein L30
MSEYVKITYERSAIGCNYLQKRVIRALGLRRLHQQRVMQDNASLRGMLSRVPHLVRVEPVTGSLHTESNASQEPAAG